MATQPPTTVVGDLHVHVHEHVDVHVCVHVHVHVQWCESREITVCFIVYLLRWYVLAGQHKRGVVCGVRV